MLAPTRWRFRRPVAAVVAVVVLVLAVAVVMADRWSKEKSISIKGNVASAITTANLTAVARTRVFFGHFSVGMNVLDAVPGVYADHGVSAPPIEQGRAEPGPNGGFIAHQFIGEDVKPLLKLEDFDRTMRGGMGRQVDVALMKFCWVDIYSNTDVDALFARYRDTMAALERDFPNVTFIHVTVPLTTEPGLFTELKTRLKTLLGRQRLARPASERRAGAAERADPRRVRRPSPLRSGRDRVHEARRHEGLRSLRQSGVLRAVRRVRLRHGPPQRGWFQDRGDSLSRGDRAGIAEVDAAGHDSAHMPRD